MTTTDSTFDSVPEPRPPASERESQLDAVFDALASDRCRTLLDHLVAADEALTVEELATRLADDAGGIRTRLHHTYLPKLEDVGLVAFDADREMVRLQSAPIFEAVYEALDEVHDADLPVELGGLFEVLANERRRRALQTLLVYEDLPLPDLADEVTVAERSQPLPEIDPDDVLQVYLSLYHTHVPKLTEVGLASYDQNGDFVTMTDAGRAVESTIQALFEAADV